MAKRTPSKRKSGDYDVFVSHAHLDSEHVLPLVQALREHGLRVWFDEHEIQPHDGITDSVREDLARSKLLLAYYSTVYPTRRACQWELTAAFLAAQRLGEDPRRRVLVVNPEHRDSGELRTDHIQPVQLRDASCCIDTGEVSQWAAEVARVAELASSHATVLGEAHSRMPQQLGQRLVDTPGFTGRLDDLWEVHSALTMGEAVLVTGSTGGEVAQITGLAGIGKSLLAEEYALRFGAAYPGGIMWLRASAAAEGDGPLEKAAARAGVEARLTESEHNALLGSERQQARYAQIRRIAIDFGIAVQARTPEEIRADVSAAIAKAEPCLWVVDDLQEGLDNEEVRAWLAPHPNAKTLITTRSCGYEHGPRVSLSGLRGEDGYRLLTAKRKPPKDPLQEAAAWGLVADLDGHPLALAVAGHRLAAEAGMRSFAAYREALAERTQDVLELVAELRAATSPQPTNRAATCSATSSSVRSGAPRRRRCRFCASSIC